MSIDPSEEIIPNLPTSRPQSSRESLARGQKHKAYRLTHDSESFDALFSSSPVAQSTPRIRLAPTVEGNGRRTLKQVPANSQSLFDADSSSMGFRQMEVDPPPAQNDTTSEMEVNTTLPNDQTGEHFGDRVTRKTSFKDRALPKRHSKKAKKHPSPSKLELEGLEKALSDFPAFGTSQTPVTHEHLDNVGISQPFTRALGPKNLNAKIKEAAASDRKTGLGLFPKPQMPRSDVPLPKTSRRKGQKTSMLPRPAGTAMKSPRPELDGKKLSVRGAAFNGTAMDIDELQWDRSEYNIRR